MTNEAQAAGQPPSPTLRTTTSRPAPLPRGRHLHALMGTGARHWGSLLSWQRRRLAHVPMATGGLSSESFNCVLQHAPYATPYSQPGNSDPGGKGSDLEFGKGLAPPHGGCSMPSELGPLLWLFSSLQQQGEFRGWEGREVRVLGKRILLWPLQSHSDLAQRCGNPGSSWEGHQTSAYISSQIMYVI